METTLNDFFNSLNDEDRIIYFKIANFAYELGYKAKRAKTKDINYVFTSSKIKRHLLKFSFKDGKPNLKMKFYASKNYSNIFNNSVRDVIEEFNFKYTGCYKCGKCKVTPSGYIYEYPDGKRYFRCGSELIELPSIDESIVPEILSLLKTQHEYYLSNEQAN
jgi:ferredoxin-like protein FixX